MCVILPLIEWMSVMSEWCSLFVVVFRNWNADILVF